MSDSGSIERLQRTIREDYYELGRHRRVYREMVREIPGDWHGDTYEDIQARNSRRPMNLVGMAHWSTVQFLAGKQPRIIITTPIAEWKPWQEDIEIDITHIWDQEDFGRKLQAWVGDGLIQTGWMKVSADWERRVADDGTELWGPRVYIQVLDPTRTCYDPRASSILESPYQADLLLMPLDQARNHPLFDERNRAELQSSDRFSTEFDGDENTARIVPGDVNRSDEGFIDYVKLWHAYDRYNDRTRVWSASQDNLVLRDDAWQGPKNGPYHILQFRPLMHHPQPASIIGQGMDLHLAQNKLLTKAIRQAERQMTILRYSQAQRNEVEALKSVRDGYTMLRENGPLEEVNYGGADRNTVAILPAMKEWFSYILGNMDVRAGLSTGAPTAFQERLLKSSGNVMIDDMQATVYEATKNVAWSVGWYAMRDQVKDEVRQRRITGTNHSIPTEWNHEIRSRLDWVKFNCDLSIYSFRNRSPQERASDLAGALQNFLIPAIQTRQMLQQTGDDFSLADYMETIAKYLDLPELEEFLNLYDKAPDIGGQTRPEDPSETMRPPQTTRTNVRMDRGGQPGDKAMELMGSLMGKGEAA